MHADIASWASEAMYEGRLRSAPSVAARTLADLDGVAACDATDPVLLLLDTAGSGMHEEARGGGGGSSSGGAHSHRNEREAQLVVAHVLALIAAGVRPRDVAVVTPYNGQLAAVRVLLDDGALDAESAAAVEVRTVDGFQGREKEAIVMSMVRSNTRGETGFLKDARRINVAATRAKRHLAIVGDSSTLEHDAFIAALIAHARAKGVVRTPEELSFDVGAAALRVGTGARGGASGGAQRATVPEMRSVIGGAGDNALRARVQAFARAATSGSALSKRALKFESTLDSGERRVIHAEGSFLLGTVIFYANLAHSLTRSP